MIRKHALRAVFVGVSALMLWAAPAGAGVVDLNGGWEAVWDSSLDGLVDIFNVQVSQDGSTIFIEKSAIFTQGPVNGIFPAIPIIFRQTSVQAATHIVIDDEIISNCTGTDWTDFHMDLMFSGVAVFNPAETGGGGGPIGFTIAPFTQAAFTPSNNRLDIWGGVVADGTDWFPGDGATDGQLWIDVTPGAAGAFTQFVLKENPTPEPATMALLAVGGSMALIRRKRTA